MQIAGDSMEPTLSNGDRVLIDMGQANLRREGIYVIGVEDTLVVNCTMGTDSAAGALIELTPDGATARLLE